MKIRRFRHQVAQDRAAQAKSLQVAPAAPRTVAGPPPRVWSLLLPPGFTNERR